MAAELNRRTFLKASSAALVAAGFATEARAQALPVVERNGNSTVFRHALYSAEYKAHEDSLTLYDAAHHAVAWFPMQPLVRVADAGMQVTLIGVAEAVEVAEDTLSLHYADTAHEARVSVAVRFAAEGVWMERITLGSSQELDVVSVSYFAKGEERHPAFNAEYFITPGISSANAINAVQSAAGGLDLTFSLGHSPVFAAESPHQLWGLPTHFFSACSRRGARTGSHGMFAANRSAVVTCGLAELPNGDMQMTERRGQAAVTIEYRSDLWHHARTPGKITLGATWAFAFAPDLHASITVYYEMLLKAGRIRRQTMSGAQTEAAFASEFCTWGGEMARAHAAAKFDEATNVEFYDEMKAAGLKAGMYSVDAKWEATFGTLEHDEQRFRGFDTFLDRVRAEGYKVGIWSAFMRCQEPERIGLSEKHMLQTPDKKPYRNREWFVLDYTQPEVKRVMAERARRFIRRYKPAMVKFDWGYELPSVGGGAPLDKSYTGERLLLAALEVMVPAMREADPNVTLMYYQLSPLYAEYFNLHSTDDLYANPGDYDLEANRRIFFGSALSVLGVATYGSGGYDWASAPATWFDSVAAGSIGAIADPRSDELGQGATPEQVALFNGFSAASRPASEFRVVPYPTVRPESSARGAHARSWARLEGERVTVIAQRPRGMDDGDSLTVTSTGAPAISPYESYVHAEIPVVVSSLTRESIDRATKLAVVAVGEGRVAIARRAAATAHITAHLHGGDHVPLQGRVADGWLVFEATQALQGKPVEWWEIAFS